MSEQEKQVKTVTLKQRAESILDGAKEVYHKHPVACNATVLLVVGVSCFVTGRLTAPKKESTVKEKKK